MMDQKLPERNWLNDNFQKITFVLLAVILIGSLFGSCNQSRSVNALRKEVDSLNAIVTRMPSTKQTRDMLNANTINSLLWEEAIDQKKMSVAELSARLQIPKDSTASK